MSSIILFSTMARERLTPERFEPQLPSLTQKAGYRETIQRELHELPAVITPDVIMNANHTLEVEENLRIHNENRNNAEMGLAFEWDCIDARIVRLLPEESFYFNTIANGGRAEKVQRAVNSLATRFALVVAHEPICGGRSAKNDQVRDGIYTPEKEDLSGFVSREIDHPSVIQAGVKAKELATLTSKQVFALVHNHEDGTRRVLAAFNRKDGGRKSVVDEAIFNSPQMQSPDNDHLLSYLPFDELPQDLQEYLVRYEEKRQALLTTNPNALIKMRDHNPRFAKIATDLRAAELWIPSLAQPGEIVRLTVPRRSVPRVNGEKKIYLHPSDLDQIWEQAEYVMSHSVASRKAGRGAFRDTDTFLIATPKYGLSQEIALKLAQQPFAQPWLMDERNKIMVIENVAGRLRKVVEIRYTFRDGDVVHFEEVARAIA